MAEIATNFRDPSGGTTGDDGQIVGRRVGPVAVGAREDPDGPGSGPPDTGTGGAGRHTDGTGIGTIGQRRRGVRRERRSREKRTSGHKELLEITVLRYMRCVTVEVRGVVGPSVENEGLSSLFSSETSESSSEPGRLGSRVARSVEAPGRGDGSENLPVAVSPRDRRIYRENETRVGFPVLIGRGTSGTEMWLGPGVPVPTGVTSRGRGGGSDDARRDRSSQFWDT